MAKEPISNYETVDGDAASQQFARLWRVLSGERQKDGTSSNRIYDGKERAYQQQNTLRCLNHSFLCVADTLSKVATILASTQAVILASAVFIRSTIM